jgi:hypothetical protein
MIKFSLFLFLIFSIHYSLCQESARLNILNSKIDLDGIIENIWSSADSTSNFIQVDPDFGKAPTYKTTVKFFSNGKSLFFLFICEMPKDKIQIENTPRDNAAGDVIILYLDTFKDKTIAYRFEVNAAGQIADAIMTDDGRNKDYSWDGVWYSGSQVYDYGYVIEIEIPFKAIRYNKDVSEWGIDFERWVPVKVEDINWSRYKREEGLRISKFNTLTNIKPEESGLAFEIYPVAMLRMEKEENKDSKLKPDAGLDLKWNPNPGLAVQLTANPDFAQIEADPYKVNLSKYEVYFNEKRPFFIEGSEIFKAAGKESNSGFYTPLEFFYSRRIGKKMMDGSEIPILGGGKVFGKIGDWDYGMLAAYTGDKHITFEGEEYDEENSTFAIARLKRKIFNNSSIGILYASKFSKDHNLSVLDLDGAYRTGDFQWAFQFARSFNTIYNGYAFSSGVKYFTKDLFLAIRTKWIDSDFNVDEIGYVPWKGMGEFTTIFGPSWLFDTGPLKSLLLAPIFLSYYEKADNYTDVLGGAIINFNFRANWGMEFDLIAGKAKEKGIIFTQHSHSWNLWASWAQNYEFGYSIGANYEYNYNSDFLAWMGSINIWGSYVPFSALRLEAEGNSWIEYKPDGSLQEITYNIRPKMTYALSKDIHFRLFLDNTILRSTGKIEQVLIGGLLSYNFSPKSWLYLAYNDNYDREDYSRNNPTKDRNLRSLNKIIVFKVRYLYYF